MTAIARNVKILKKGPDKRIAEEGKKMTKALFLLRGTIIMRREKEINDETKRALIGHLKEKEWICQLSLHLSNPLHCSYFTDHFEEVVFLTFDDMETYEKLVGRHYAAKLR